VASGRQTLQATTLAPPAPEPEVEAADETFFDQDRP
jgi:hypothetical protein